MSLTQKDLVAMMLLLEQENYTPTIFITPAHADLFKRNGLALPPHWRVQHALPYSFTIEAHK